MLQPPRPFVLLALFLALLAPSLPAGASPHGPEYDAAFDAMMENPTDLETTFAFAVIARRAGDFEGAVGALERMLIFNPDLPVVHYELARLYVRLGSGEVARRYFRSALRYDPPPEIRAEIEAGLARLDQAAGASSFSGSVYLGLRYQSNANAGPDEPTVRVGGLDARLAEEFLDRDDTSTVASARLAHRYDLGRDPAAFIVSEFSAYAARQSEIEENDVELLAGTIGPEFVRSNGVSLRPFVRAELVGLGGSVFYRSFGAGIAGRGAVSGTRNLLYFFDAGAFRRNFEPSDRSPTLDRRDGESYRLGAGLRKTASPTLRVSGTVGWERQNSRAKSESYTGGSVGVRLQRTLKGPFGERDWSLFASGQGGIRHYDSPDPTVDPSRRRHDTNLALSVGAAIPFSDAAAATLEVGQQWRRSNLPNFEYRDTSVSAGIRFSF